jgi:hypothetical protein
VWYFDAVNGVLQVDRFGALSNIDVAARLKKGRNAGDHPAWRAVLPCHQPAHSTTSSSPTWRRERVAR